MTIGTLFLDASYRQSLEQLAIKEGLVVYDYEGNEAFAQEKFRNRLRRKTLVAATVFDHVDANFSLFDCQPLCDVGLIKDSAVVLSDFHLPVAALAKSDLTPNRVLARQTASSLLRVKRPQLISQYKRRLRPWQKDIHLDDELRHLFDVVLEHEHWLAADVPEYYKHREFVADLEVYFGNIEQCSFLALEHNGAFTLADKMPISQTGALKVIEDTMCIAKTSLKDEIVYLPEPSSLAQALRMRDSRHMVRFRSVLAEWCDTLIEGNHRLEAKVRKDVRLANQSLRKLESWRRYEKSPINFAINAVGGHIPVLSNILSLVNTIATLVESSIEKRNAWTMVGIDRT